jgi:hypothetical protein
MTTQADELMKLAQDYAYFAWDGAGSIDDIDECPERAALRSAIVEALGQWRPIAEAPKDELILLAGAKRSAMVVGMRHSRDGWVIDTPSEWATMYTPTHWMPLPDPPAPPADALQQMEGER